MVRSYLLVVLALLTGLVLATLVDRHVLGPRREAARLVAEARPFASSTNAAEWLAAESLLAKAELHQHGLPAITELRALITQKRAVAQAEDEKILRKSLEGCLATIEKVGRGADASALRAELGKALTRELHVRCVRVQLEQLAVPAPSPVDAGVDAGADARDAD